MSMRILDLVRHGHYHAQKDTAKYGKLTAVGKRFASVGLCVVHHSDANRGLWATWQIRRPVPNTVA